MKASTLVEIVNKLIDLHGDFQIGIEDSREGTDWLAQSVVVEFKKNYGMDYNKLTGNCDIPIIKDSFVIS